ncbi:concanavalin A-like lectin/glucanases superfamily protein [Terrimicrobium sacchariphilum]|uniref:Concanavalin A-like lectin/glucanases superfamily protein n=2 Tax=Terrimicrobium sacchariphilum TaxID=690879 RepID=A0A146G683_TERSA|nr:concanavalin A-like lectin/glucanases superfamily protein [Terrimicrobium sacchariphilum]
MPFQLRLPKGTYQINWGDGTNIVTDSQGYVSHVYRQAGSVTVEVSVTAGGISKPYPWSYDAMIIAAKPLVFLSTPGGDAISGPADNLPRALPLQGEARDVAVESREGTNELSADLWVRLDSLEGRQVLVASREEAGGFALAYEGAALSFSIVGAGVVSFPVGERIAAGKWHHVAVVYDAVPLFPFANTVRVYVDGQLAGDGRIAARHSGPLKFSGIRLGGEGVQGAMSGFALYDKVLFPLSIWDRYSALASPNKWNVSVAFPGSSRVTVVEPKILKTIDVPLDPDPAADNGPAIRSAVTAAQPGTRLRLVDATTGKPGTRFSVKSLIAGNKWAAILIEGKQDLELNGGGATLVFSQAMARYLYILKSARIAVRDLSFDIDPTYARPGLYAKILDLNRETGVVTAQLVNGRDGSPDPIIPSRASYWRWRPHDPVTLRHSEKGPAFRSDIYAEKPVPDGSGRPGVIVFKAKKKPEDKFWDELKQYVEGDNFYMINNGDFSSNAVSLDFSEDVVFERVNYYATLGMVFLSSDIRRVRVAHCVIGIPPGMTAEDRPLSAGADGYHFHLTQGDIVFENNEVTLTDDDPISIKDSMWGKLKRLDNYTLDVGAKGFTKGDPVELLTPEYESAGYKATVVRADGTKLTLSVALPATIVPGSVLMNRSHHTKNWILRGNYFHDYYGRIMLYTDYGTVVGNRVHDSLYHLGISNAYFEVAGVSRNVVTHRNLFDSTNADTANWGGNATVTVFNQITYSANSFVGGRLLLDQVSGGAMIRNAFYRKEQSPRGSSIQIKGSRNVVVSDNLQFGPGADQFLLKSDNNTNLIETRNRVVK